MIAAKITRKGQITIPRVIREKLRTEVIEFDVVDDQVVLRPLVSVAGSLAPHAKKQAIPFQKAREKAWDRTIREEYGKETDRR